MLRNSQNREKTRKIIVFLSVFAILTGIFYYFLFLGDIFAAVIFTFVNPFLLFLPRLIYRLNFVRSKYNENLLVNLEIAAIVIFIFNGAGTLYFYDVSLFEYDSFVHFLDHILFAPIGAWLYLMLKEAVTGKRIERVKFDAIIIGGLLAIMAGVFWEILQNTADNIFGTTMFFDPDQAIDLDVKTDIASDLLGALVGTIVLYFQKEKWLAEIKALSQSSEPKALRQS